MDLEVETVAMRYSKGSSKGSRDRGREASAGDLTAAAL
jgi:hypothetical protein